MGRGKEEERDRQREKDQRDECKYISDALNVHPNISYIIYFTGSYYLSAYPVV